MQVTWSELAAFMRPIGQGLMIGLFASYVMLKVLQRVFPKWSEDFDLRKMFKDMIS